MPRLKRSEQTGAQINGLDFVQCAVLFPLTSGSTNRVKDISCVRHKASPFADISGFAELNGRYSAKEDRKNRLFIANS